MKAILVGQRKDLDKQDKLTFDEEPKENSQNPVTSGGVYKRTSWMCNPNLLDNWYFGNPVNQRGQTTYTASRNATYTIDRWRMSVGNTINIQDGYIESNTSAAWIQQVVDILISDLQGTIVTMSCLTDKGLATFTTTVQESTQNSTKTAGVKLRFQQLGSSDKNYIDFSIIDMDQGIHLIAAKLELGSIQTLAHQEHGEWVLNEIPNVNEQLNRCLPYQINFFRPGMNTSVCNIGTGVATSQNSAIVIVPLQFPLRKPPTLTYDGQVMLETPGHTGNGAIPISTIEVNVTSTNCIKLLCRLSENLFTPGDGVLLHLRNITYFLLDANL